MYTIGQVSKLFSIPISTLRYYDKEGLFPDIQRASGIRKFSDSELDALRVIDCLKKSGMEIRDIKQFMRWCSEGSETYGKRHALFLKQKDAVEAEMAQIQRTLSMIRYKCWYYEQAAKNGSEAPVRRMLPDRLPPDIQALYDHAHGREAPQEKDAP
ncbi:MerR family transcriptional regulator [Oscillospiraceae bacterium OttesenSCG-928-F05]|nr:MerR family transcriptional regulator [Oscillospiraceae bacterium OttesenSCG-928-F05]